MKKLELSKLKLDMIIELKQRKYSWLRIQRETSIPRRTAKKAYDSWLSNQEKEKLTEARIHVAEQEFREHMVDLIKIAETFASSLPTYIDAHQTENADAVIEKMWNRELTEIYPFSSSFMGKTAREQQRIVRRNRLLFESLKEHTRENLAWQKLRDWKVEWDNGIKLKPEIICEANQLISNIWKNQKDSVRNEIKKSSINKNLTTDIAAGVTEGVLYMISINKLKRYNFIRIELLAEHVIRIMFGIGTSMVIQFFDENNAKKVMDMCEQAAKIIMRGQVASKLLDINGHLTTKVDEIDIMLDSIEIKPVILRTHCKLCPA